MLEEKENQKKIEVINGDGSNLVISPVYEHINAAKPREKNKSIKNVIVPSEKKLKKDKK